MQSFNASNWAAPSLISHTVSSDVYTVRCMAGRCQAHCDLVEMCIHTMVPPLILYLLHVSSAWIWIILSCSPQGAFLFHVHMDLSLLQKRRSEKHPSVWLWLLTFDHYYYYCDFYSKYGSLFSFDFFSQLGCFRSIMMCSSIDRCKSLFHFKKIYLSGSVYIIIYYLHKNLKKKIYRGNIYSFNR